MCIDPGKSASNEAQFIILINHKLFLPQTKTVQSSMVGRKQEGGPAGLVPSGPGRVRVRPADGMTA